MIARHRATLVLAAGVGIAVAGAWLSAGDVSNDLQERLESRADRVAAVLELELRSYAGASRALAALRADGPSQQDWIDEVGRIGIARDLPSVLNNASTSLDGAPPDRRLVIDLVAPLEPNRRALGIDVLNVPGAASAAARAVDQQVVSMSDAFELTQETGDQFGLVVYAPWYGPDGSVGGATDIAVRGQDLMDALVSELGDVGVRVVDIETPDGPRLVGELAPPGGAHPDLSVSRRIRPLGQMWDVEVTAPVGFASTTEVLAPWLTLAGLLAVTVLVAALVRVLQRRAEHAGELVSTRTVELVEANRELEAAVAAKDDFLAVLTHEFRTPITVIRGFAETAVSGRSGDVPPTVQEWLRRIDRQAARLHTLLDNVLTAARLQAGDLTLEPERVDVGHLAATVVEHYPELAPLEVTVEEARPMAWVDPGQLVRVLDALLSNASKYGEPPVALTVVGEDTEVVLRVRDHGEGVPVDVAPRIFSAFEQADRGDMRRSRGVGLGLAVVHELCTRMGGSVHLQDVEEGACFEVRLPRAPEGQDGSRR